MGTKISDLPVTGVLPADAVFPLEYGGANYSVKASDLGTGGSGGGSSSSGTTSAILPFAHARIFTNNAGTGIGMSWGAYNNGYVEVTFDTAQPDTDYYVVTDRETYDQHLIDVDQKTISGFRTKWVNSDNSLLPPGTFGGMLTVYGSTPTIDIGGGSGPRAYASFNGSAGAGIVVTQMAGGANQSLFVKSDGSYWAMGSNGFGQFGNGTNVNNNGNGNHTPEQILASGVTQVSTGSFHSLFLKSNGSLWAMGYNVQGQLGTGNNDQQLSPVEILSSGVTQIAAGGHTSLFVKSDGSLHAMGKNDKGQLGTGNTTDVNSPTQILASGVAQVVASGSNSFFLKTDGSLWGMGWNAYGQLGDGTNDDSDTPVQILASGVTQIDAGGSHSLFVKTDGSLWVMGRNLHGQFGDGTNDNSNVPVQILASGVTQASAGTNHSHFLKSDGSLWAMGRNNYGQLGDGFNANLNTPVQIIASGVTQVATGGHHSLFLSSGNLRVTGWNASGQLGDGTNDDRNSPVSILSFGIAKSFNIASVTYNETGDYTVAFTDAITDPIPIVSALYLHNDFYNTPMDVSVRALSSSSIQLISGTNSSGRYDLDGIYLVVF